MSAEPWIDLHRHLDGNIRISTILDLAGQNGIALPATDEEGLRPFVTVTTPQPGLLEFLEKFRWSVGVLKTPEDCWRVAFENVEDARNEGLGYAELRFSPYFMGMAHGIATEAVVAAVADGIAAGVRDFGVGVGLIGILSRTFGPATCMKELDALLASRERLVAVDLAGDEAGFPPELFVAHFDRVREAGLGVTIHAGEAAGPESVWNAIRLLGATRIGHGVRAAEDPRLLDFLGEHGIGIECCPTSNVQTSTVPGFDLHPLRMFLDHGLLATINTDDPAISAIRFEDEIGVARERCGLTPEQVVACLRNARKMVFPASARNESPNRRQ
jgi:adenosine deaminase